MKFLMAKKGGSSIIGRFKSISNTFILFIAVVIIFIMFSLMSKYFLTFGNIVNLLQQSSILGITACAMTFVIISGNFDISIGSIAALVSIYSARFVQWSGSWALGLLGGIVLGLICGLINALIVNGLRINPLITTLATMTIFSGMANLENNGIPIPVFDNSFKHMGQGYFLSVPIIVWILLFLFVASGIILKYTTFGRRIYSIGGNIQASYFSGINVKRNRFYVFVISGGAAGLAGVMYAALVGAGTPNGNQNLAMDSISAVILGGANLFGGTGTIIGTALGVILIGSISNALVLANMSSYYQMVIKGIILVFAVGLGSLRNKGRAVYE